MVSPSSSKQMLIWSHGSAIIWSYDHRIMRPYDHMVTWSYGHIGTWSYDHTIISSQGSMIIWSYGHMIIWTCDHMVTIMSSRSLNHLSKCFYDQMTIWCIIMWPYNNMLHMTYVRTIIKPCDRMNTGSYEISCEESREITAEETQDIRWEYARTRADACSRAHARTRTRAVIAGSHARALARARASYFASWGSI